MALFGEELLAISFAQHLLGIGSAVLVYVLGRLTVGRAAGAVAAIITALNGALIIAEHYLMPGGLARLPAAADVRGVRRRHPERAPLAFLASGLLLGLTLLCKPVAQVLIPVLPFMLVVSYASVRRGRWCPRC